MKRLRVFVFFVVLGLAIAPVSAQVGNDGTITSAVIADSIVLDLGDRAGFAIQVSGTFTATLQFECSLDGGTYVAINAYPPNSSTAATSTTTTGLWLGGGSCNFVRVRGSAYTSGTANVRIWATADGVVASTGAAGGGGGGDATAANQVIQETSLDAIQAAVEGTVTVDLGANNDVTTDLGQAEDTAHTTADTGVPVLAVRQDTEAALAGTTGDYIPLTTNATGALYVGSSELTAMEADISSLVTNLGTDSVHDSAVEASGPTTMLEAKDQDGAALPNAVGAEADAVRAAGSLSGVQYVMAVNEDGSAVGDLTATLNANSGVDIGDVDVTSFPDNEPFNQAQVGGTAVVAGHCDREEVSRYTGTIAVDTQIITGTGGEHAYICSLQVIVGGTAEEISLTSGTGTVCATGPTALLGSTTDTSGAEFAANGGIALSEARDHYFRTGATGDNVCARLGATNSVTIALTYVSH